MRLGCSIEADKWFAEETRVKANTRNRFGQTAGEINRAISEAVQEIDAIFAQYDVLEHRIPTIAELKSAFDDYLGKSKDRPNPASFYNAFSEFVSVQGRMNEWTDATYMKFKNLRNHLLRWNPDITFAGLSDKVLSSFTQSLLNEGLHNTTIYKYIEFLRWFLRWAATQGYNPTKVHETYRPRLKGIDGNSKEIIYLEWEELMNLYSLEFPASESSLAAIRDVFCFCCFTGLRYSDVAKLKRSDIFDSYINVVTKKTADALRIELNNYSRDILDRWSDKALKGKALPVISNQKMNERLRDLGRFAGLDHPQRIVYFIGNERKEEVHPKWKLLTTHCGRRTFVVNALRLGVPAEVIMSWTGHSDFKSMKPYVKIVDKLKEEQMAKFNIGPSDTVPDKVPYFDEVNR